MHADNSSSHFKTRKTIFTPSSGSEQTPSTSPPVRGIPKFPVIDENVPVSVFKLDKACHCMR